MPSTRPGSELANREGGLAVLTHRLASVLARLPAEAAVHRHTELVQVLRRCLVAALDARNAPRQTPDRPGEALPSRLAAAHPRDHALDVLDLVADVPLDRELGRRDLAREPLELAMHEVHECRFGSRVVRGEVDLERVQRA